VAILAEIGLILWLNKGFFVYTLDDAYIHLALAENIINGHYGINLTEYSAPSSSILFPFIIAPFSSFGLSPLIINVICASITIYVYSRILNESINVQNEHVRTVLISSLLILFILCTNLIGLIFTGMEHSLQLLAVSLIALGLIVEVKENKVEPWLLVAIIVAPLIRYENLSIALAAIGYLFLRKYFKKAALALFFVVLFLGGFSVYLITLGLGPLPTSILLKSSIAASGGGVEQIISNIINGLSLPIGMLLGLGLLCLLVFVLFSKEGSKRRQLAAVTAFAVAMHLIAGRYGWYNRYEIYIWSFLLFVLFFLAGDRISSLLEEENTQKINSLKILSIAGCFVILTCWPYLLGLISLPIASNNIYEQHYQMHRFAVSYYKKPVAVNDIGYVSYKNIHYVLDLYGLASIDALDHRKNDPNSDWMNNLAKSKNVEFAMIYPGWFKGIPDNWIKVGSLHLSKVNITPAENTVTFYALSELTKQEVMPELQNFIATLPDGVEFHFE
jgi:hypothetical protein